MENFCKMVRGIIALHVAMAMGYNYFFRGNATSVNLNVITAKLCEEELTTITKINGEI